MLAHKTTKSYDDTTATANAIIDAEKQNEYAKTARLREARLAKEAADLLAHEPDKRGVTALKRKAKR